MQTGENEQALRKTIDFTRLLSIAILLIHFYLSCYPQFVRWHLTAKLAGRLLLPVARLPIFKTVWAAKGAALALLLVSLAGTKGRKDEKLEAKTALAYAVTGLLFYVGSCWIISISVVYMAASFVGLLLLMTGISLFGRLLLIKLGSDIFNKENE